MRQLGGARRYAAALMVLGSLLLAGCSQMSNPTYDLNAVGCAASSDQTLATIQQKVTADGSLRNGKQVTAGDQIFVSAELHLRSDKRHDKGDILTWVTKDPAGSDFFSVDVNARDDSKWPPADITVTAPGARESRACSRASAGKTKAQIQCELDQASGDIPADRNCGDL
ncbi:MAG: hypothetical protein ACHQIG_01030 [Acidimicrobiia bacterium]